MTLEVFLQVCPLDTIHVLDLTKTCTALGLGLQIQEIPLSRGPIDHRTILTMQLQQKVQFSLVGED